MIYARCECNPWRVSTCISGSGYKLEKMRKVVRRTCSERRKISLLIDVKIRKRFKEKLIKLLDVGAPNLWGHFKDGVFQACDYMCGKKRGRRSKGDSWWWNEGVKEAVSKNKEAHKAICQNNAEANKRRYKSMRNKAMKAVSKGLKEGCRGAY